MTGRRRTVAFLTFFLALAAFAAARAAFPARERAPRPGADPSPAPAARVVLAGVRSSSYGIKPFPEPDAWRSAIEAMTGRFPGSAPYAVWIVGVMSKKSSRFAHLDFPAGGVPAANVEFDEVDKHERYLEAFDKAGIKVFLQVEPADADMGTLIDLVLGRYGRHACVAGFGVDVEWHRIADVPKTGLAVDDTMARAWEARVKAHNASYRLFLKHWDARWMPPTYRGDIVFVDDSQIFPGLENMVREFSEKWAPAFYPNLVLFQVGYNSDKPWWSKYADPPKAIGEALRRRVRQDYGIIWVDFSLRDVVPLAEKGPAPIIGVKIYESPGDLDALFAAWREAGINTAFVSAAMQSNPEFRRRARANHVATYIIFPVFFDMDELGRHPDLAAITDRGVRAEDDWVKFICPTRRDHLERKIAALEALVKETDPDGISLDFIRNFVFWEMVYPDRDPATLANSCFDDSCLERFQKETGIGIPAALSGAAAKARWILDRHAPEWTRWKCGVIAGVVEELAKAARAAKPGIRINVHAVPWRAADFGGAGKSIAGQDLARIAPFADFISPMCYHHMVKQTPAWVHAVVEDMARTTGAAILPSIQVKEAYIPGPETAAEFRAALAEALKPPSRGVVFWNWVALAASPEKLAAVREAARGRA